MCGNDRVGASINTGVSVEGEVVTILYYRLESGVSYKASTRVPSEPKVSNVLKKDQRK